MLPGLVMPRIFSSAALAAVSFVASAQNTTSGTTMVVNMPIGTVNGDLMVFVAGTRNAAITINSVPSGWGALIAETTSQSYHIYGKIAASEGASYSWGFSSSSENHCAILTYRAAILTGAVYGAVQNESGNVSQVIVPSIASTLAGLRMMVFHRRTDSPDPTSSHAPLTQRLKLAASSNKAVWIYDNIASPAGTQAAQTVTWAATDLTKGAQMQFPNG